MKKKKTGADFKKKMNESHGIRKKRLLLQLKKHIKPEFRLETGSFFVELYFEPDEELDKDEIEKHAGKIIAKWVKRYNSITPGIIADWKQNCLSYCFATDRVGAEHFKHILGEEKGDIIF